MLRPLPILQQHNSSKGRYALPHGALHVVLAARAKRHPFAGLPSVWRMLCARSAAAQAAWPCPTRAAVRYQSSCVIDTPSSWTLDGLPAALGWVLANRQYPAIVVIDGWWVGAPSSIPLRSSLLPARLLWVLCAAGLFECVVACMPPRLTRLRL